LSISREPSPDSPVKFAVVCGVSKPAFGVATRGFWGADRRFVQYRVDTKKAISELWSTSHKGVAFYFPTPAQLDDFLNGTSLSVRVSDFLSRPHEAVFPLGGAKAAVATALGGGCGKPTQQNKR
jgi:hypothetical protein